jgi:hypothetical protein
VPHPGRFSPRRRQPRASRPERAWGRAESAREPPPLPPPAAPAQAQSGRGRAPRGRDDVMLFRPRGPQLSLRSPPLRCPRLPRDPQPLPQAPPPDCDSPRGGAGRVDAFRRTATLAHPASHYRGPQRLARHCHRDRVAGLGSYAHPTLSPTLHLLLAPAPWCR